MGVSLRNLFQEYLSRLQAIYPDLEAQSLVYWLFEAFLGKKRLDIIKNDNIVYLPEALEIAVRELMDGKPIQYILGEAPFYGRNFKVNPDVLIPRNETEELVHLIIKENPQKGLRILDIGTGSGCIPITLALELEKAEVFGIDISEAALTLAKENARNLNAKVDFQKLDILEEAIPLDRLDMVVSNPPYVRYSEKEKMHKNVLEYEPHLALFVFDEDPLLFYRVIGEKAKNSLKLGGRLYFEINEALGEATKALIEGLGYIEVRILRDLNGKERILTGVSQ